MPWSDGKDGQPGCERILGIPAGSKRPDLCLAAGFDFAQLHTKKGDTPALMG